MKKDKTIETLRGGVILLVVVGHVIGSEIGGGMNVADDSFLRYLYYSFIDPIQMPLFTILAGWVYNLKPPVYSDAKSFMIKKVLRLMIPMFVVGFCYYFIQYFIPGTNKKSELIDFWKLLIFPYTLYWYLYSLFFVFIIVGLFDVFGKLKTLLSWLVIFCVSVVVLLIRDIIIPIESLNYFSYKGTLYLLPSFLLGLGLNRFKSFFQSKTLFNLSVFVLVVCFIIQQLSWFKIIDYLIHKDGIVDLLIGFTTGLLLLRSKIELKWLISIGGFSYTIFLFHGFGTAAGRIIPRNLNFDSIILIFIMSLIFGMIFPIIVDKCFSRFKLTRILFLGK